MSADALASRSTSPARSLAAVEPAQRTAAKAAGFLFLFNYAACVFGQLTPSMIKGSGDFAERAQRALASEHLYRSALVGMTIAWASIVLLSFALFVALEPVNRRLAQLALFFRLGEAFVGAVTVIVSFAVLRLYAAAGGVGPFQNEQVHELAKVAASVYDSGFLIAMMLLSPGSFLFFYLFYKSRYIPRALALLGVFGTVLFTLVNVGLLVFPEYAGTLQYGWGPMGVAEIATALWLLIGGIRPAPVLAGGVVHA